MTHDDDNEKKNRELCTVGKNLKKNVENKARIDAKIQLKQAKLDEKNLVKKNKEIVKMKLKKLKTQKR
jgi:hypothetical protein